MHARAEEMYGNNVYVFILKKKKKKRINKQQKEKGF